MKVKILLLFTVFFLIGCKQEQKKSIENWEVLSSKVKFLRSNDSWKLQSGKFDYEFKKFQVPFKKVVLLNASLSGYISQLSAEDNIAGISSPEYIYSEKIQSLINSGKIQNIGNEQKYDIEKIIALKPDAIFTNYIANFENVYEVLKNNGIQVIFLDEYTEQKPLEKASYIKLFGKLLGKEKEANALFSTIEKDYKTYSEMAKKINPQPEVLANEMYGNIWYMPGGKTSLAQFITDAGGNYILKRNTEDKAVNMSFEEVFSKAQNTEIWVNAGSHTSKKEILSVNPSYAKLNVFQKGKIYGISGKQKDKANDYFESGIVRADLVLKDYIKIFHPEVFPNYTPTYMNEIR